MLTRLAGGHVIDPVNDRDGSEDIWIRDGRIVAPPPRETRADTSLDVSGKIVMAGGIDIHSHIAGANVNTARLLLPEYHHAAQRRPELSPLVRQDAPTGARPSLSRFPRNVSTWMMGMSPEAKLADWDRDANLRPHR